MQIFQDTFEKRKQSFISAFPISMTVPLSSKFIRCQAAKTYQMQNLRILSTFQGLKNPYGQNFWNSIFFFWKDKLI